MLEWINTVSVSRNCLGTVQALYTFIHGSPKRLSIFKNAQLCLGPTSLKRAEGTRWSFRERAIDSLISTYPFVLETLNFIDKTENLAETRSLLKAIEEFDFQFVVRVLQKCYDLTGVFCLALQAPETEMDRCSEL